MANLESPCCASRTRKAPSCGIRLSLSSACVRSTIPWYHGQSSWLWGCGTGSPNTTWNSYMKHKKIFASYSHASKLWPERTNRKSYQSSDRIRAIVCDQGVKTVECQRINQVVLHLTPFILGVNMAMINSTTAPSSK